MKTRIVGLACAVLLVASVLPAYADPIAITSGRIETDFDGVDTFYLNTAAFTISQWYIPDNVQMPAALTQGSYTGGPTFAFHSGESLDFSAVLDGIFRENRPGNPTLPLSLNFAADPVQATMTPILTPGVLPEIRFYTPFRMTATGAAQDVLFTGAGTLTAYGTFYRSDTFTLYSLDWRFSSPSSSPTPEPASMLLLGAGLVGVVVRRFRVG